MLTLGIETSCDETSASLVRDGVNVLSCVTASSLKYHKKYHGIIPEIASRAHIESIVAVTRESLAQARVKLSKIDLICVTKEPGLIGSLLVGISFAKAIGSSLNKPVIGVHHLYAHLYANFLSMKNDKTKHPQLPFIGLVVSGGHTSLFIVNKKFQFKQIGQTVDDAAGEAFDKVAAILGLGYPGGPEIEKISKKGDEKSFKLSCAGPENLNFSFSGIKTAVLYLKNKANARQRHRADIAASFQKAIVDALVEKSIRACIRNKIKTFVVGGGVAANEYFRKNAVKSADYSGIDIYFPPRILSLDNAAMIAGLGYRLYRRR